MKLYKILLFLIMIVSELFSYLPSVTLEEAQSSLEKRIKSFNALDKNNRITVRFIDEIAIIQFKNKEQLIILTKKDGLFVYHACMQDFQELIKERID